METPLQHSAEEPAASRPCGLVRRLLVMAYDAVTVVALLILAAAAILPFGNPERVAGRDPLYTLYLTAVWFGYLGWCWHRGGTTLGMRAWQVRLVSADGGLPGWSRCGIRFAVSLLSALAAGLGFLAALRDPQHRTWHDRASRTRLLFDPRPGRRGRYTERRST